MRIPTPFPLVHGEPPGEEPDGEKEDRDRVEDNMPLDVFLRGFVFLVPHGEDGDGEEEQEGHRHEDCVHHDQGVVSGVGSMPDSFAYWTRDKKALAGMRDARHAGENQGGSGESQGESQGGR